METSVLRFTWTALAHRLMISHSKTSTAMSLRNSYGMAHVTQSRGSTWSSLTTPGHPLMSLTVLHSEITTNLCLNHEPWARIPGDALPMELAGEIVPGRLRTSSLAPSVTTGLRRGNFLRYGRSTVWDPVPGESNQRSMTTTSVLTKPWGKVTSRARFCLVLLTARNLTFGTQAVVPLGWGLAKSSTLLIAMTLFRRTISRTTTTSWLPLTWAAWAVRSP